MGTLPIGWQQLVEIARVIFSGAGIIILDEPTSALSPPETARLYELMRALKAQGKALIFISHFLDDVLAICDRITVLKNGRRVATLTASRGEQVAADRAHDRRGRKAPPNLGDEAGSSEPTAASARETLGSSCHVPRKCCGSNASASAEPSATCRSRSTRAEVLGCFAFMGAGQAQLGRCLFGAERAEAGTVTLNGEPLQAHQYQPGPRGWHRVRARRPAQRAHAVEGGLQERHHRAPRALASLVAARAGRARAGAAVDAKGRRTPFGPTPAGFCA